MLRVRTVRMSGRPLMAAALAAALLLSGTSPSFAQLGEIIIRELPPGYATIRVGHDRYFFHKGRFYVRRHGGYAVIPAPIGAVVPALPLGFVTVMVGGASYYVFEGVYYRQVPEGFMVVAPPPAVPPQPAPPQATSGVAVVQTPLLNIRSGPAGTYPVIGQARMGERLRIIASVPGWYQVQLADGRFGWVMTQFTVLEQPVPQG